MLIVSVQGKREITNTEIIRDCINAGAEMIRTDKPVKCSVPIIGLKKIKVKDRSKDPYITPTLEDLKNVKNWAMYIAVDCRQENHENLKEIFSYAEYNKIRIVADIADIDDYYNLTKNLWQPYYITTALGVYDSHGMPPYYLMDDLISAGVRPGKIIAEGNINSENRIQRILQKEITNICIGTAISDPYKLTKRYLRAMMN